MRRISYAGLLAVALAAAAFVGWVVCSEPASAAVLNEEEAGEHPGFLAAKGRITYRRYCASCHGSDADGKGNVAQFLTVRPTDLRTLLQKYEGEYPKEIIFQFIDGRKVARGHGSRDMPVWGEVFQSPLVETAGDETGEERAARKVRELVYYLETLQLPVEEKEIGKPDRPRVETP